MSGPGVRRIVIAEDHALVRAGFRRLLEALGDVEIVAEATNGREALAALKEHRPDLLILDLTMPELNGIEVLRRARKSNPSVDVLVLSMHEDREYVLRAFSLGAAGYLVKGAAEVELRLAVRSIAAGSRYVSPKVATYLTDRSDAPPVVAEGPFDLLTPRQREVLQLLAEGNSTAEIAEKLYISRKTVETHRADIQQRLGIKDVPGLVRYAIKSGLTSLE